MAIYDNNEYQFVAVLNGKIEMPKLLNALGHMAVGLSSLQEDESKMEFLKYYDADQTLHPAISKFPFIILKSKNGNQIRSLRQTAIDLGIPYNDFTDTMLGYSAENQLSQTKETKEENLNYFGICLFGESSQIKPLTKRFSLFK